MEFNDCSFLNIHHTHTHTAKVAVSLLVGHPVHKMSREGHCPLHEDVCLPSEENLALLITLISSRGIVTLRTFPTPVWSNLQKQSSTGNANISMTSAHVCTTFLWISSFKPSNEEVEETNASVGVVN